MANPPVCRIMDYGRFKYENELRAKESRRKTTNVGIKEMKYRPKIGSGDFNTKTRQVARFLGEGHKVKVTIMFRGREMSHPELGKRILDKVAEEVAAVAKVEAAPKLDGRNMIMVLAPDKRAQQAAAKAAAGEGDEAIGDEVLGDAAALGDAAVDEAALGDAAETTEAPVAATKTEPAPAETTEPEPAPAEPAPVEAAIDTPSGNGSTAPEATTEPAAPETQES
jgi:translation initiation factor IF-3